MKSILLAAFAALFLSPVSLADDTEHEREVRKAILADCKKQVGSFGAALVKSCVEQNVEAYEQVKNYGDEHQAVIEHCKDQMLAIGNWFIVQSCIEMEVEAEASLEAFEAELLQ